MTWASWFDSLPLEIQLFVSEKVLEKNKEIEKTVGKLPDIVKHKNSYFLATTLAEARAFREFVEAMEKVKT